MAISENTNVKEPKKTQNMPERTVTELNMMVLMSLAEGKTQVEVAKEFKVTPSAINQQIKKVQKLIALNSGGELVDCVNGHRLRLQKNFKRIEDVYSFILKPGSKKTGTDGWKTNHERLKLAQNTAIQLDKGLGVLRERTETPPESFEDKRLTVVHKLELATQYGAEIPQEIQADYEIMGDKQDEKVETGDNGNSRIEAGDNSVVGDNQE